MSHGLELRFQLSDFPLQSLLLAPLRLDLLILLSNDSDAVPSLPLSFAHDFSEPLKIPLEEVSLLLYQCDLFTSIVLYPDAFIRELNKGCIFLLHLLPEHFVGSFELSQFLSDLISESQLQVVRFVASL